MPAMRFIPICLCCVVLTGVPRAAATPPATKPAVKRLTIVLVGDSTVTDRSGWGKGFAASLAADVACINLAQGGRSSKSFRDEGHWDKAIATKADYVLIQFGHNDQPGKGPARETDAATTFPANLKRYVDEARAAGMKPVLVTSLVRRRFDADGKIRSDLVPYADATKNVAAETNVPLIDLHALSISLCNQLGEKGCASISPVNETGEKKGTVDSTHLNAEGGIVIGKLVAGELAHVVPQLAGRIINAAASASAPVTIVLAGDSTVTDKAGWGKGFAALLRDDVTLINLSRGGRSSRTFYDEGLWKQCLATRAGYVLIQFGHNDEPGTNRSTNIDTEFPANMRRYVTEAREAGMTPVLITPLVRRQFKEDGKIQSSLARHAQIVRDIAREMNVAMIELHDRSLAVCNALGAETCIALLSTTKPGGFDGTHLTTAGALLMGAIVADELKRAVHALAPHLRAVPRTSETPTTAPAATTRP